MAALSCLNAEVTRKTLTRISSQNRYTLAFALVDDSSKRRRGQYRVRVAERRRCPNRLKILVVNRKLATPLSRCRKFLMQKNLDRKIPDDKEYILAALP